VRTYFGQGEKGVFRCGSPYVLVQNTSDFSKFMVSARTKGLSQCGHLRTMGRGSIFCDFVRISCMNGP